jgi:hypothetical protein
MKTIIVPLIGDPLDNLFQLGLREKEAFIDLENRVKKLLSTNHLLSFGQDFISRTRFILKKKEESFFNSCITAYSQGLGIEPNRYLSFISLFEVAAHFGQIYPELKGILPGCTSVFTRIDAEITHSRLMDFPLIGIFDEKPRIYFWKPEGKEPVMTYSCEGLAPLFFQGLHGSGVSFAIHHKPGKSYYQEGQSIFEIVFESVFESQNFTELKKELKKKKTVTKWSVLLLDKSGQIQVIDIDGPAQNTESYNLMETSPVILTNIPLQHDSKEIDSFIRFSEDRQNWIKERLSRKRQDMHMLDLLTHVEDQKGKKWVHPSATLSTIGAWHVNLTKGFVDLKEGLGALTTGDRLLRVNLSAAPDLSVLREKTPPKPFEEAWKRASRAQSAFDQGDYDTAYHELQMAQALMPDPLWKEIMNFYLCVWDFKFIGNSKELSMVYKKLKSLRVPETLKDQWVLMVMRMEKRLDLSSTVTYKDVSTPLQELFQEEKLANKAVFATWMKLLYPRMEILDVFSPHRK